MPMSAAEILDLLMYNYACHKHAAVKEWPAANLRVVAPFTLDQRLLDEQDRGRVLHR